MRGSCCKNVTDAIADSPRLRGCSFSLPKIPSIRPIRPASAWEIQQKQSLHRLTSSRLKASSSGNSDTPPGTLSVQEARKILGVGENATFEQTVQAKNRLLSQTAQDSPEILQIEIAYDILLMRSMKQRISGELQPAREVRFADVPKYRPTALQEKSWQQKIVEKLPGKVQVQQTRQDSVTQGIVFGILAASALLQEFFLPSSPGSNNVPGLQLGLAFVASVYFLRDGKKLTLVRAGALTTAGLAIGTLLGSALQSWLRVDIVPIGELHSPAVLVGEFSILSMWLTAYFLA